MNKSLYIIFIIIIVNLLIRVKADDYPGWINRIPYFLKVPCNESSDISISFEPGQYKVAISKQFPSYSVIKIQFDKETSVKLVILSFILSVKSLVRFF